MRPAFPARLSLHCALIGAALASPCAGAQDPAPAGDAVPPVEPDISLTATVRARSVEFHSPPRGYVELDGTPGRQDVDRTWLDNLPEEVLPGRTYRDIGVRFEASTTLDPAAFDASLRPLPPTDETPP